MIARGDTLKRSDGGLRLTKAMRAQRRGPLSGDPGARPAGVLCRGQCTIAAEADEAEAAYPTRHADVPMLNGVRGGSRRAARLGRP